MDKKFRSQVTSPAETRARHGRPRGEDEDSTPVAENTFKRHGGQERLDRAARDNSLRQGPNAIDPGVEPEELEEHEEQLELPSEDSDLE